MSMVDRAAAYVLLRDYTKGDSLIKHSLAVEAGMRFYARSLGGDEELWAVTGLIHDFDYEQNPSPESHPMIGVGILESLGYPESVIYAIKAHAEYLNVPRIHAMDKALFACDELSGFLTAVALVRPSKSILDVEVASVRKKMKDKPFARAIRREDIALGADELGINLDEHITNVLHAMRGIAGDLGLLGVAQSK
jgi:putative nucleotidyltransferase with HDIG domain